MTTHQQAMSPMFENLLRGNKNLKFFAGTSTIMLQGVFLKMKPIEAGLDTCHFSPGFVCFQIVTILTAVRNMISAIFEDVEFQMCLPPTYWLGHGLTLRRSDFVVVVALRTINCGRTGCDCMLLPAIRSSILFASIVVLFSKGGKFAIKAGRSLI